MKQPFASPKINWIIAEGDNPHYHDMCTLSLHCQVKALLKAQHINIVTVMVGFLFHYYHNMCTLSLLWEKSTLYQSSTFQYSHCQGRFLVSLLS